MRSIGVLFGDDGRRPLMPPHKGEGSQLRHVSNREDRKKHASISPYAIALLRPGSSPSLSAKARRRPASATLLRDGPSRHRNKPARASSAPLLAGHAPDHIADIVRHQNGAVGTERYPYRSSIGHPLVGREKPAQNIPRRSGR